MTRQRLFFRVVHILACLLFDSNDDVSHNRGQQPSPMRPALQLATASIEDVGFQVKAAVSSCPII